MTVRAFVGESSRTSLGGERGTEVAWSAGDAIGLWGDASTENRRFEIDDACAGRAAAEFTGEAFESEVYYGYYPYREDAVVGAQEVVTTLPSVQAFGGSGTFAAGYSPMAACSRSAESLHFASVCGVVRLYLTGTASIRSIRLTAMDGAALSGRMRIGWDAAAEAWSIEPADAGRPSLLLDCGPTGVPLSESEPTCFCLVVPPGRYGGWKFTITDTAGTRMVRETSLAAVVLEANHIKTYNPFAYVPTEPASVALDACGTANCYVVPGAGSYEFDATTMGCGAATPPAAEYAGGSVYGQAPGIDPATLRPVSARLLWQTSPDLIGGVTLGGDGRIGFSTADPFAEGNAVVAACDADGTILWSWHLWLTQADLEGALQRYVPSSDCAAAGEAVMMDRNIGALAASYRAEDNTPSCGMFYQWGRKDPFVPYRSQSARLPVYDAEGTVLADAAGTAAAFDDAPGWHLVDGGKTGDEATVEYVVRYPMNFVCASDDGFYNWYRIPGGGRQRDDLWGCTDYASASARTGTKTIYDPCPPGYRVPHRFVWSALAATADAPLSGWYTVQSSVSVYDGLVFFAAGEEIYYPAAGALLYSTGRSQFMGSGWYVWSNSPYASDKPQAGAFVKSSLANQLTGSAYRSLGAQVRCMKE